MVSAVSFSDIRWYRGCGPQNLRCQTILLRSRKRSCKLITVYDELDTLLPDFEIAVTPNGLPRLCGHFDLQNALSF